MPIFLISLPIFLIIFSGWLLKKFKVVTDDWIHILNVFAYYVSLPALIVNSFWEIDFLNRGSMNMIFWSLTAILLMSLAIFIFLHLLKIDRNLKTAIFLSATVGNTIYMGFPLVELGFGKNYLPDAALVGTIYLIVPLLITILLVKYWHCRENCLNEELVSFIKNPLTISVLVGVVFSFIDFGNPFIAGVKKSVSLLGATASPVALFALGGFIYGRFLKKDLGKLFLVSFLKMIIFPFVIVLGALYLFKMGDVRVLILLASSPVAVTTFVIAEKFNLDKDLIGNSIIISTILSFIVAPLVIYLFR